MFLDEPLTVGCKVYVRYRDHVMFARTSPDIMSPQTRERIGWLVYDGSDYVIVVSDRDSGPATLKGGDSKADGLVILRSCILELKGD